jgi:hypothetical protein
MSTETEQDIPRARRLESKRKKADRYSVSTKTVDRWVKQRILKPPIKINNRDYFDADDEPTP